MAWADTWHRMGVALLFIQISANNWRTYGSIFGNNEIVRLMLSHDIFVLGVTDGIMCASTIFCLLLQMIIARGYLRWDRSGWILQNVCRQDSPSLVPKRWIADSFFRFGSFSSSLRILHSLDIGTGHGLIQSS